MTIARGQMNRQLYQDGSRGIRDLMEGKISDDEIRNIISVLEDVDIVDDEMSDEDNEVMERLQRLYDQDPNYQYNENNMYEGPRDMRAGGGVTSADAKAMLESYAPQGERLAFVNPQEEMMLKAMGGAGLPAVAGIPSYFSISKAFKSITKPIKKAVSKLGDVVSDIDLEDAAAVAALMLGAPPQVVGPAYGAAGGDNPLIQGYTAFSGMQQPGGGFSFAPQQPGGFPFPGQTPPTFPQGQDFGISDILRIGSNILKTSDNTNTDTDEEAGGGIFGDEWEITPDGKIRRKGTALAFDVNAILDTLGLTKKEALGGAGATGLAALAYADRKKLLEELEKARTEQRAGVERFRKKFETTAGTRRPTGRPTKGTDVVRRPQVEMGGIMDLDVRTNPQGVQEIDYREKGGFVPPIGIKEKADDIPAMLSNNEFVFTADAVRAAGGGSVNKGAEKMYALMKQLEGQA